MKRCSQVQQFLRLTTSSALAARSVIGDWLVKDGYAHIRIDNCGGKMWGIVAWEKKPGGIDSENPDPAKKEPPDARHADPDGHGAGQGAESGQGEIYNSQNGKMYSANISLADENTLDLRAASVTDFLC